MKFIVIGGDAAGMSAASRVKRNDSDIEIIVLEKTEDVSYSACGMPYNIADADREIDDLVVRKARIFREKQKIDLRTGHVAESINTASKEVKGINSKGEKFSLAYDKLLIATGAVPIMPDLPGFDLSGVMPLKNLEHGRRIKDFIRVNDVQRSVIIGMGPIAMEMAEALHARNIQVDMIKPRSQFLPWLAPSLAEKIQRELISHGIGIHSGYKIKRIEHRGEVLNVISDDLELKADMVLVAIGVKPANMLAETAGLKLGASGAIAVNKYLQTSDPDIYAAGDCAEAVNMIIKKPVWIPLALIANRGGWTVADNICGQNNELPGIVGTAVFKVFNLEVARTGINIRQAEDAGFEPVEVTIKTRTRAHSHPGSSRMSLSMVGDKKTGRLLGVQMVASEGAAHRINAAAVALHAEMSVDKFSQSDMAYAPPFGPVWDPLLTAANQLLKKMKKDL
ncbi:CoA-dependent NAD(P)H sulfur oxidoreductase [Candidatus Magnetomoraceae bacterium gMMP-15]